MFYKDLNSQNRQITRPNSIKESYPEFAEAMISKLKSYLTQCQIYQNQCLKEFRECVTKFEIVSAHMPELIVRDLYFKSVNSLNEELESRKAKNVEVMNRLDFEKVYFIFLFKIWYPLFDLK